LWQWAGRARLENVLPGNVTCVKDCANPAVLLRAGLEVGVCLNAHHRRIVEGDLVGELDEVHPHQQRQQVSIDAAQYGTSFVFCILYSSLLGEDQGWVDVLVALGDAFHFAQLHRRPYIVDGEFMIAHVEVGGLLLGCCSYDPVVRCWGKRRCEVSRRLTADPDSSRPGVTHDYYVGSAIGYSQRIRLRRTEDDLVEKVMCSPPPS
jgi:hypothetical protein